MWIGRVRINVDSRRHRGGWCRIRCNGRRPSGWDGHCPGLVTVTVEGRFARGPPILIVSMMTSIHAGSADCARSFHGCLGLIRRVRCWEAGDRSSFSLVRVSVVLAGTMFPHADITTDADSATLIGDQAAQLGAFAQAGKFLRTKHLEWSGPDIETCGHVLKVKWGLWFSVSLWSWRRGKLSLGVGVACLLSAFQEAEAEAIPAFVAHREIRKDEVSSGLGTLEIVGPSKIDPLQRCYVRRRVQTTTCYGSSILQRRTQDEGRIVLERDVGPVFWLRPLPFIYTELNDWRRIYRTAVG